MIWIIERKKEFIYRSEKGNLIIETQEGFELARILGFDLEGVNILINRGVKFVYADSQEEVESPLIIDEGYYGTKFCIQESGELLYRHHSSGQIFIKIIKLDVDDYIVVKNGIPQSLLKFFLKRLFSWLY